MVELEVPKKINVELTRATYMCGCGNENWFMPIGDTVFRKGRIDTNVQYSLQHYGYNSTHIDR